MSSKDKDEKPKLRVVKTEADPLKNNPPAVKGDPHGQHHTASKVTGSSTHKGRHRKEYK